VLGDGGKGVGPSEVILLDRLSQSVLGTVLYSCPPEGTLGGHEPNLPCNDGTFSVVQLLLPGEELLLQLIRSH
jgi:hypothetical protein